MLSLTIWMNIPSFHQEELFRAVAAHPDIDLQVIYAHDITDDRIQLGWERTLTGYEYYILDQHKPHQDAIRLTWTHRNRIHIVNSFFAERAITLALTILGLVRSHILLYSEAPEPIPRPFRRKMLKLAFLRWLTTTRRIGLLSVSRFSKAYFTSAGLRGAFTYDFGYFRSAYQNQRPAQTGLENKIELVYVGRLIELKGVDVLFAALTPLFKDYPRLHLTLIGTGPLHAHFKKQAAESGYAGRITFKGLLPSRVVRDIVAGADILVLPSRRDGWGMVINEALSVGIPVIASDKCGAAELLEDGKNGFVFHNEDVENLRSIVRDYLNLSSAQNLTLKSNAQKMGQSISASVATSYLVDCINHFLDPTAEKPLPPWKETLQTLEVI